MARARASSGAVYVITAHSALAALRQCIPDVLCFIVGRLYSAASVLICTPHAIAEGGKALGTIATDAELRDVFETAGYKSFRRATETPTNRVFEARP